MPPTTCWPSPAHILQLVIGACHDSHSCRTAFPWYGSVASVNFIMHDRISEGREVLNFSLWDKHAGSEVASECGGEIQEGEMPPGYCRSMHSHSDLDTALGKGLIAWCNGTGAAGEGSVDAHGHEEEAREAL